MSMLLVLGISVGALLVLGVLFALLLMAAKRAGSSSAEVLPMAIPIRPRTAPPADEVLPLAYPVIPQPGLPEDLPFATPIFEAQALDQPVHVTARLPVPRPAPRPRPTLLPIPPARPVSTGRRVAWAAAAVAATVLLAGVGWWFLSQPGRDVDRSAEVVRARRDAEEARAALERAERQAREERRARQEEAEARRREDQRRDQEQAREQGRVRQALERQREAERQAEEARAAMKREEERREAERRAEDERRRRPPVRQLERVAATRNLPLDGGPLALAFSPNGLTLATGDASGLVLWDPRLGSIRTRTAETGPVRRLRFSRQGDAVAVGSLDRSRVAVYDPRDGRRLLVVETAPDAPVHSFAFVGLEQNLATASGGQIRYWHPRSSQQDYIAPLLAAADGRPRTLGELESFKVLELIEVRGVSAAGGAPQKVADIHVHAHRDTLHGRIAQKPGAPVALSPTSTVLATFSEDRTLVLHRLSGAEGPRTIACESPFVGLTFSPTDHLLATTHADGRLRLWRVADGAPLVVASLDGVAAGELRDVAIDPHGAWFAVGTPRGVLLFDTPQLSSQSLTMDPTVSAQPTLGVRLPATSDWGEPTASPSTPPIGSDFTPLMAFDGNVDSVALAPGDTLLAASQSGSNHGPLVSCIDLRTRRRVAALWGRGPVHFTPEGRLLFAVEKGEKCEVRQRDAATFALLPGVLAASGRLAGMAHAIPFDREILFRVNKELWSEPLDGSRPAVRFLDFPAMPLHVSTSRDGKRVAASLAGKPTVVVHDVTGKKVVELNKDGGVVTAVAIAPNGSTVAVGFLDGSLRLWDASSGELRHEAPGDQVPVRALGFSGNGNVVVAALPDGRVRGLRIEGFAPVHTSSNSGRQSVVRSLAVATDGRWVAFAEMGSVVVRSLKDGPAPAVAAVKTPVGPSTSQPAPGRPGRTQFPAVSGPPQPNQSGAAFWPSRSIQQAVNEPVRFLAFHSDGKILLSSEGIGVVRWWRIGQEGEAREPLEVTGRTEACRLSVSKDGNRLCAASMRGAVVWDLTGDKGPRRIKDIPMSAGGVLSPDGKQVVALQPTLEIRDAETGERIVALSPLRGTYRQAQFSPDGSQLAVLGSDRIVRLYEVKTGKAAGQIKSGGGMFPLIAYLPDGRTLVTTRESTQVEFWSADGKAQEPPFRGHRQPVGALDFTPDGRYAVSATMPGLSRSSEVLLWEVATRKIVAQLRGHTAGVAAVAFAPDGKTVASGSDRGTIHFHDVSSVVAKKDAAPAPKAAPAPAPKEGDSP